MPTPMWVYDKAAERWGSVDPTDRAAVERFFTDTLATLSPATREEIIRYLVAHDSAPATPPSPEEIAAKEAARLEHLKEQRKAAALKGAATRKARIAARAALKPKPRR